MIIHRVLSHCHILAENRSWLTVFADLRLCPLYIFGAPAWHFVWTLIGRLALIYLPFSFEWFVLSLCAETHPKIKLSEKAADRKSADLA
jgi:hypothetical protein